MDPNDVFIERLGKIKSTLNSELTSIFKSYPINLAVSSYKPLMDDWLINIFGPFDYVRAIRPGILPFQLIAGEYYIANDFSMNIDDVWIPRGFYPLNFVKYALGCGYIEMSDVTYGIMANKHVPCNLLNTFVNKFPIVTKHITEENYPVLFRQIKCQYMIDLDKSGAKIPIPDEIRCEYSLNRPKTEFIKEDPQGLYRKLFRKNALVTGMPGCGKTHELIEIVNGMPGIPTLVTAFTHAAMQNVQSREILYADSSTFRSALWCTKLSRPDYRILGKYRLVILEEYTMLPPHNMFLLMKAWEEFRFQVICFGDPDQCPAPVDDWVPYHKNPLFLEMCGHTIIELQYKDGYARYDKPLHSALLKFKETGKLTSWLGRNPPPASFKHVVFTNRLRGEINEECFDRWVLEKNVDIIRINKFRVCIGLPVMCYNGTDKIRGIFKTQEWIITDVDKTEEKIGLCREGKYVVLPWNEFCELFEYSFAITAHKCQGITIKEDFVVHETNIMIWEVAYTAISRGTALSKVHIAGSISEKCLKRASRSDSIALKII